MLLQLGLLTAVTVGVIAALALAIFLLARRGAPPPPQQPRTYTPGEEEILNQLASLKERIEKFIPPYGRIGYVPSSASELAELLGFQYVKIGREEHGLLPEDLRRFVELDVDEAQIRVGNKYIYIMKKDNKKLIAIGDVYLDYLTLRFLEDFLSYIDAQ